MGIVVDMESNLQVRVVIAVNYHKKWKWSFTNISLTTHKICKISTRDNTPAGRPMGLLLEKREIQPDEQTHRTIMTSLGFPLPRNEEN